MKNELTPAHHVEITRVADLLDISVDALTTDMISVLKYRQPNVAEIMTHAETHAARRYLQPAVDLAVATMRRSVAYYWALASNSRPADVIAWVSDNVWNATSFVAAFPMSLPMSPEGLVDEYELGNIDYLDRALLLDQEINVYETSATGGGDDTWFDYLPDAIMVIPALQAEDWNVNVAFILNNIHIFDNTDEKNYERFGFTLMDDNTQLFRALALPRDENDTTIYGPNPFA